MAWYDACCSCHAPVIRFSPHLLAPPQRHRIEDIRIWYVACVGDEKHDTHTVVAHQGDGICGTGDCIGKRRRGDVTWCMACDAIDRCATHALDLDAHPRCCAPDQGLFIAFLFNIPIAQAIAGFAEVWCHACCAACIDQCCCVRYVDICCE